MINQIVPYIHRVTGQLLSLQSMEKDPLLGKLPLYIVRAFSFHASSLLGRPILFVVHKGQGSFTPLQYRNMSGTLERTFGRAAVFVLPPQVPAYTRQRIAAYGVSFVIPGKHLFLPSLLIDLNERKEPVSVQHREYLQPAAQLIALYSLQKESLEGLSEKEIIQRTGYSAMTVSRAVRDICWLGVASTAPGKEKRLHFEVKGRGLWEKVLPHLRTPVKRKLLLVDRTIPVTGVLSSFSALSEYSMLSPENRPFYAIGMEQYTALVPTGAIKEVPDDRESAVIEVWRYDPALLSRNGLVDPLSLYLVLKDDQDERVQGALEEMLEEQVSWQ